ncbi:endolysin [Lactococcus phage 1706]|uniref:Putative amidase n=1 Tax=Lactococcus phage 1706 TaxID=475178 RepID=B2BTN7_9CAUD|nr:endolysin [Lactococcus phage 1706]ABV91280.1 putative amidase [Lactococcus phage 1706]
MSYIVHNDGMIPNPKTQTVNYGGRQFIVIHSTADLNAIAGDIDQYFDSNWSSVYAFVQWAIDDKEAWQNYDNGFRSWGAGNVNSYAWSQIEICEFQDDNRAKAAIANAIQLTKALVNEATAKGVKVEIISHKEAAQMFGGSDHVDPIPYFNRFGYTMDWFRQQVGAANGGSTNGGSTSNITITGEKEMKVITITTDGDYYGKKYKAGACFFFTGDSLRYIERPQALGVFDVLQIPRFRMDAISLLLVIQDLDLKIS